MARYILQRLGQTLLILIIVSFITYLLVDFLPGDPIAAMTGGEISGETYDRLFHEMNMDKPVLVRYFLWLRDALTGNLGMSASYHRKVADIIGERVPVTLYLSMLAFLISVPLGIIFGIISAVRRGSAADTAVTLTANICCCLPQFWLGILFMYVFAMKLGWLPSSGFVWPHENLGMSLKQTIMPLLCLAIGGIASITRQTRSSMLEVIRQDYVRTARSKGLKSKKVIYVHALKNALLPVITLMGLRLGGLIGGSVFVENVFVIPGMGSLLVNAITSVDIPLIQGCVLLIAVFSCVINLITDIVYVYVDPRIKVA
ncbi:MAG: ABC transporter permease [Clostridia bacterium]|nr:ABC transporter permease [Clostridia bacterium]